MHNDLCMHDSDSIETHVEESYTRVQSGTEQLSKAREYQV